MADSPYTLKQYQALCAAYAQGALSVKYGDKEVEYRSLRDMEQIMEKMKVSLGLATANRKRYARFSKGLV